MNRKLILSNSKGLSLGDLKNWIISACDHQTDYDVGLILLDNNSEILDFCAFKGVKVFPFFEGDHAGGQDYFYYRPKLVSKTLRKLAGQYDYVILTDVKDVVFQEDPFPKFIAKMGDKDAVFTSENILISAEPWNQNVLFQLFGGEVCDKVRENDVINSGVMFGRPNFLADVNRLMYDITHCLNGEKIRDQAALQYLYFFVDLIRERSVLSDGNDYIVTHLAVAGPTKFYDAWGFRNSLKCGHAEMDMEKIIVKNPNGEVYSIAHQYNRCDEWNELINKKYEIDLHRSYRPQVHNAKVACVVCTTPSFNNMYRQYKWDKELANYPDLKLLYDCTSQQDLAEDIKFSFVQENLLYYNLENLQLTFDNPSPPQLAHRWSDGGSRNINWFYPHLRMLYYYLAHPDYDYYWFMDDDCSLINGNLSDLLNATSYSDADCIITYIFTEGSDKQEDTLYASQGMSSYHGDHSAWFHWFPGPGDKLPEVSKKYGSYFPFVRLSKAALMQLHDLHKQGYLGYSEGYVPTVLNHYGFKLHSLNKEDGTLNVPCETKVKIAHKQSEILWRHL